MQEKGNVFCMFLITVLALTVLSMYSFLLMVILTKRESLTANPVMANCLALRVLLAVLQVLITSMSMLVPIHVSSIIDMRK